MKLAGKRFWTWMSVAVFSLFVKGESGVFAQEKTTTDNPSSTSQFKHNVPGGPYSKARIHQDKVVDKISTRKAGGTQMKSGFKTTSRKAGVNDVPTESLTRSKHIAGVKKPK